MLCFLVKFGEYLRMPSLVFTKSPDMLPLFVLLILAFALSSPCRVFGCSSFFGSWLVHLVGSTGASFLRHICIMHWNWNAFLISRIQFIWKFTADAAHEQGLAIIWKSKRLVSRHNHWTMTWGLRMVQYRSYAIHHCLYHPLGWVGSACHSIF